MNELNNPPSPPLSVDSPRSPTESEGLADWEEALRQAQSFVPQPWKPAAKRKSSMELPLQQDLSSIVRLHPDIPLPELPLEVHVKILKHVFLRPTPTIPTSPHRILKGSTHLLLVSKSYSAIALPVFLRSITISRTSDLITFFGLNRGIFVAGEEGRTRWNLVKEICFDSAELPLSEDDDLLPLTIPRSTSHRIDRFVLLEHKPPSFDDWDFVPPQLTREEEERLAANQRRADQQRKRLDASTEASLRAEQIQEGQQDQTFEDYIETRTGLRDVRTVISLEVMKRMWKESFSERRTLLNRIVFGTSPRQLHLSLLAQLSFVPLEVSSGVKMVVIHYAATSSSNRSWPKREKGIDVVEVAEEVGEWLDVSEVRLVGFPSKDLDSLVERVGLGPSRIRKWTWEVEEGNRFELLNDAMDLDSDALSTLPSQQ